MRHESPFPVHLDYIVCEYLKNIWECGWLDEYSDDHFMEGGDKYPEELDKIIDEMRSQNYESFTDEAEATISEIQDYFTENGGTCKIINEF